MATLARVRERLVASDGQGSSTASGRGWELGNWLCEALLQRMRLCAAARPSFLPVALSSHLIEVDLSEGIMEKTNECVWLICVSCPALRTLKLAKCNLIDIALKPLSKHLLNLEHLDISECRRLTPNALVHVREIKSLGSLRMRRMAGIKKKVKVEAALVHLSNASMPQLKHLDLAFNPNWVKPLVPFLKENSFDSLVLLQSQRARDMPPLELNWASLKTMRITQLTVSIPSTLPSALQRVELESITREELAVLAECCPSLAGMAIVKFQGRDLDSLSRFTGLERLRMYGGKHEALIKSNCASLTSLFLYQYSDAVVCHALQNCTNLRTLHLRDSNFNTTQHDDAFKDISVVASLQKLDLDGPYGLTDVGIAQLVKSFPNLKFLRMRNSYHRFTDYSLSLLAGLHKLRVLDLGGYKDTSDKSVVFILRSFPQLRVLDVTGWTGLSQDAFARLERGCLKRHIKLRTPRNNNWRWSSWMICKESGDDEMLDRYEFYAQ